VLVFIKSTSSILNRVKSEENGYTSKKKKAVQKGFWFLGILIIYRITYCVLERFHRFKNEPSMPVKHFIFKCLLFHMFLN